MGSGPGGLCGGGWADRLPRPRPLTDLGSSLVRSRFRVARPGLVTATAKPSSSAKTLWFLGASASSPHRALFPARLCRPHSLDAVRCHRNVDPGLAGAQASAEASSGRGEAPPAGTRGGRRLRPAPAQTEPAAATGRCARAAKAPRGALRRGTMSSLYTRSKEFPRSRRAQPESPPASPSPTAKALRVSGAPLGTCRPWRGSGPGRRLLAGVGEGAQPRPAQRQSAWQRGSGVLVTLPPGAGVGLCSCSRGARGCRPTRSPMRAPRVCVRVSVRATAFARLGVRGRQGQLATRAVLLLIPRKRARGAREAAPAAGTSREGRRGRRARGLRVRECFRQSRCRSSRGHVGVRSSGGRATRSPLLPAEPCAASMREAEGRCAARRRLPRRESLWSRIRSVACRSGRRSSRTPRGALRAVSLTVPSEGGPRAPARGSGRPSLPRGLVPCLLGPHSVEPFSLVFPAFPPPSRRSPLLHLSTP